MESSQPFGSCQYAIPSPSGEYIASLTQQHLYVQWANSLSPAYTFPLDTDGSKSVAETSTIQWSASSLHVLLLSAPGISVFSLHDTALKINISNGSGGLGKIVAAEIVGDSGREHVLVMWEFGRVNFWDLSTGKGYEIGEAKMGLRGTSWAVRRQEGRAEVLALLSRVAAQDVLSFFLSPDSSPLKSVTVPSSDARHMSWSPCGRWLSFLDSSLASPSLFIYTADGHLFRTYPSATSTTSPATSEIVEDPSSLGYKSLAWSTTFLALASSHNSITILSTRTFTPVTALSHSPSSSTSSGDALTAYQENISAAGVRSYSYLTGTSIPRPSAEASLTDLRFNASGTHLASRDEATLNSVSIWSLEQRRLHIQLLLHSNLRKIMWHPSRASLLLLLSEDGSVHLWDVVAGEPPVWVEHAFYGIEGIGRADARWLAPGPGGDKKLAVLVSTRRQGWLVVWPEGRDEVDKHVEESLMRQEDGVDQSEDSLYDILTGRTPLPELSSRNARFASVDAGGDEDAGEESIKLDDTFREKKVAMSIDSDPDIF